MSEGFGKKQFRPVGTSFPKNLYDETYIAGWEDDARQFCLPSQMPTASETVEALQKTSLTEKERLLIIERYCMKRTFNSIGDECGVSGNAIRRITRQAERKLRLPSNASMMGVHIKWLDE